jgi:hypothetical protein
MESATALLEADVDREDKERYAEALQERDLRHKLARAHDDVNAFMEYCFTDEVSGLPFIQAPIHRDWHAHIEANPWAGILAPREHAKTTQIAIGRTLWRLGRNPDLRIKIISSNDDEATKRVQAIGEHIERNRRVHEVFPDLRPAERQNWTKHSITVQREVITPEPSVEAYGVLATGSGARADEIIFDDPVDFRNAILNPGSRKAVIGAVEDVWLNLLTPEGRVVYIATPWHNADLTAKLKGERKKTWAFFERFIDKDYTPLWPEKWPRDILRRHEERIGKRAFARGFFGIPLSDEDAVFNLALIGEGRSSPGKVRDYSLAVKDVDPSFLRFLGADLGISKSEDAKYTAIWVVAYDQGRNEIIPLEVVHGRYSSPETARKVVALYKTHRFTLGMIENNAYQNALLEWIRTLKDAPAGMPLQGFCTGAQKADLLLGVPGLAAEMDAWGWRFPLGGHDDCECPMCGALGEFLEYPVGKYTDNVMAAWLAREAVRSYTRSGYALPAAGDKGREERMREYKPRDVETRREDRGSALPGIGEGRRI